MTSYIEAGELRDQILLQACNDGTKNALGEVVRTWADGNQIRARVRNLTGKEQYTADQTIATMTHEVKIRGRQAVSVKDRIIWKNRTLQVENITNPDGRDVALLLLCVEIAA